MSGCWNYGGVLELELRAEKVEGLTSYRGGVMVIPTVKSGVMYMDYKELVQFQQAYMDDIYNWFLE